MGRGFVIELAPTFGVSALSAQGEAPPARGSLWIDARHRPAAALRGRGGEADSPRLRRLLADHLAALHRPPGTEPFFPYYDNRSQRLVLLPALGVRVSDRLALGASLNVLGGVKGPAQVLPGASGALESRIALRATTTVALRRRAALRSRRARALRDHLPPALRVARGGEHAGRGGGVPIHVDVSTRARSTIRSPSSWPGASRSARRPSSSTRATRAGRTGRGPSPR
jgi:hypothetical protein